LADEGWKDTNADGTIDKKFGGKQIELDLDFYITGSSLSKNIALLMQKNAKEAGISDNDDPKANNDISYRSPKADALIEKIRSTKSDSDRNQYYKELQQVMYDDQPAIFLYNPTDKLIVGEKWKGSSTTKRPGYFAGTFEAK